MLLKLVVYDEEYFIVFLIYNNDEYLSIYILYARMKSPELAESTTHI